MQEVLRDNFSQNEATISSDFSEENEVYFIRTYLKSIFYNFVSNAIKYRHPQRPPRLEIYTKKTKQELCLTFKDNGLGIDLKKTQTQTFWLVPTLSSRERRKRNGLVSMQNPS